MPHHIMQQISMPTTKSHLGAQWPYGTIDMSGCSLIFNVEAKLTSYAILVPAARGDRSTVTSKE